MKIVRCGCVRPTKPTRILCCTYQHNKMFRICTVQLLRSDLGSNTDDAEKHNGRDGTRLKPEVATSFTSVVEDCDLASKSKRQLRASSCHEIEEEDPEQALRTTVSKIAT